MIQELIKQKEDKYSQLIKECGVFFAFSNSQFEENKTPLQEGEKYVSMGHGGYMPKSQVDRWKEGGREIQKWFEEATKDPVARRRYIAYQLANHECYFTGEIEDALEALGPGYTAEEVRAVYWEEYPNQNL